MRTFLILLLATTLALAAASNNKKSYKGFQVLRVSVEDEHQARSLRSMQDLEDLDFWTEVRVGRSADIMVSPTTRAGVVSRLAKLGLKHSVMIKDVGRLINDEAKTLASKKKGSKIEHDSYHTTEEMNEYFFELEAMHEHVSTRVIGQSYEGRDMVVIQICQGGCGNKPAMWIQAGIHAREWISPATAMYLVDHLTESLAAGDQDLIDGLDWYILPSVNPDGYYWTQQEDRMWRKTRRPNAGGLGCVGTDANRNYDYMWAMGGSSTSECSDTYMGPEAFSEVENQNIRDFIGEFPDGYFQFFQDLHSYSQLVLLPFGHDDVLPDDYDELFDAFSAANDALYSVHQMSYEVGNTFDTIYEASGIAVDWGYGGANIKYSVSVELRDTGNFGFLLPPTQIIPTGEEMWAFHASIARHIIAENSNKK